MSFALGACGSLNNIYWKNGLPGGGEVITVDAKQRHTFLFPDPEREGQWRICAEAAPDVFAAVATSAAGDVSINGGGPSGGQSNSQGSGSVSISESAATIGKTQTVNAIRESMYRTCERWLSGALSKQQFIVQAARDQNMMLRILAVEQLTGAARTQSTAISAAATQAAVENNKEAIALSQKLAERAENSDKVAKENLDLLVAIDEDRKICRNGQTKPDPKYSEGENPTITNQEAINKWDECDVAHRNYKDAKDQADRHNSQLSLALTAAGKAGAASSTAMGSALFDFNDETAGELPRTHIASVAEAVKAIAAMPSVDEALMFCLAYLDSSERKSNFQIDQSRDKDKIYESTYILTPARDDRVTDSCLKVLEARATADNNLRAFAGLSESDQVIADAINRDYEEFKSLLTNKINNTDNGNLPSKIQLLEKAMGVPERIGAVESCQTKENCIIEVIAKDLYYSYFQRNKKAATIALNSW